MDDNKYKKWSSLMDAETCGRQLSDAERAFCERVVSESAEAAAEAELFGQLANPGFDAPGPGARALVERALERLNAEELQAAMEAHDEPNPFASRPSPGGPWLWATLAAAGGVAAAWALWPIHEPAAMDAQSSPSFRAELVYASGEVRIEGQAGLARAGVLKPGQVVRTHAGRACLVMEPGIDMCIDEDTRLQVRAPAVDDRGVDLLAGSVTASLDKQPAGTHFSIRAGRVVATAIGTVFGVAHTDDHGVVTTVNEGIVRVEAGNAQRLVRAHERVSHHSDGDVLDLEPAARMEEARMRGAVKMASLWRDGLSATITLDGPQNAEALLDGSSVGHLPVVVVVPAGNHHVGLADQESQLVRLAAGEHARIALSIEQASDAQAEPATDDDRVHRTAGDDASRPARVGTSANVKSRASDRGRSVQGLLEAARKHAMSHRFRAAARAYQAICQQHRKAPEAHAVLVALGELQLTRLGQPGAALRTFDRYLTEGGPLAQEAMHGRIRALAALGRSETEQRAIRMFLWRYPASPHRQALERRAEQLASNAPVN